MQATDKIPPKEEWSRQHAAHLLKRSSFSGSAHEVEECYHMGLQASVNLILTGRQPGAATPPIRSRITPRVITDIPSLPNEEHDSNKNKNTPLYKHQQRLFTLQLKWLQRMLDDGGPLEKMALFWHGMLTSSYTKVKSAGFIARQNQLFREFAFGNYKTLIKRVLLDPAMVVYLDIDKNKRTNPNENFARELLELFTLGEGNYSSSLIKKIAREIVGLKLKRRKDKLPYEEVDTKGMETNSGFSDQEKRLSKLIDSIFDMPVCGELLVRRLWKFYVSEDRVDEDKVKQLAYEFRNSDWQVAVVLEKIFLSRDFYDQSVVGQQIKSPVQYVVQAHKELGLTTIDKQAAYYAMQKLGQSLLNPPSVSGWSAGATWINGTTLSGRYELSDIMNKVMKRHENTTYRKFHKLIEQDENRGLVYMLDHFLSTSLPLVKSEMFAAMAKRVKTEDHVAIFILYLMCMPEYQMC